MLQVTSVCFHTPFDHGYLGRDLFSLFFFFFGFVLVLIVVPLLKYLTRVLFRYCEVLDKMFSLGIANVLQNS